MKSDTLCPYPWIHLTNNVNGSTKPCCDYQGGILKDKENKYYLQENPMSEIYASGHIKKIRQEFRDNKKPVECRWCWDKEDAGLLSKRQKKIQVLKDQGVEIDYNKDPEFPTEIQIVLNNSCNLKCRMCGPLLSSEWVKETKTYSDKDKSSFPETINIDPKKYFNRKQVGTPGGVFIESVEEWGKYIKEIEVIGGEPFYSSAWEQVFDKLIEFNYSKKIMLHITTNGTIYPSDLLKKLQHNFKHLSIALSIDGMGKIYEYIRSNGEWEKVYTNAKKFLKLKKYKNCKVTIVYTYNWLNIIQFPQFYYLFKPDHPNVEIHMNKVTYPAYWALDAAPPDYRTQIAETLSIELQKNSFTESSRKELENIIKYLKNCEVTKETNLNNYKNIFLLEKYREGKILKVIKYIEKKLITPMSVLEGYSVTKDLTSTYKNLKLSKQI